MRSLRPTEEQVKCFNETMKRIDESETGLKVQYEFESAEINYEDEALTHTQMNKITRASFYKVLYMTPSWTDEKEAGKM